jgi:hypothetical protein
MRLLKSANPTINAGRSLNFEKSVCGKGISTTVPIANEPMPYLALVYSSCLDY